MGEVIEKHFVIDRNKSAPDASFCMELDEIEKPVEDIRLIEKAMVKVHYNSKEKTKDQRIFKRSIFVLNNIIKGERFTETNIRSIRPGHGISPRLINNVLGKTAKYDIEKGIPHRLNMIEDLEE